MSEDSEEEERRKTAKLFVWLNRKDTSAEDRKREAEEKEAEEREFKKAIEESARKNASILETISSEKWKKFVEENVIPTQELLKYFKTRLDENSANQTQFVNYVYTIYKKALLKTVKEELDKTLNPRIKQLEEEKQALVGLYYQLEKLFESLVLLLATKLDQEADAKKILKKGS